MLLVFIGCSSNDLMKLNIQEMSKGRHKNVIRVTWLPTVKRRQC